MVILDTDHMTILEWESRLDTKKLRNRLRALGEEQVATTVVSYEEQLRGWLTCLASSRSVVKQIEAYQRLRRQLQNYCSIRVLDFDETAATTFQRLRKSHPRKGTNDLRIAAIVLAHDATLLTRNLVHFRDIGGLKIEDWTVLS